MATENLSRGEIISWINDTLKLSISKIECIGTGAIACQLFDCLHPTKVQISKVNWKSKNEYEFMSNFKVLQQAFSKIGLSKQLEVEKLIKCKCQDNLEFIQWVKKYFDSQNIDNKCVSKYDPIARRAGEEVDFSYIEGKGGASLTPIKDNKKIQDIKNNKTPLSRKQSSVKLNESTKSSNKDNEGSKSSIGKNEDNEISSNKEITNEKQFNNNSSINDKTESNSKQTTLNQKSQSQNKNSFDGSKSQELKRSASQKGKSSSSISNNKVNNDSTFKQEVAQTNQNGINSQKNQQSKQSTENKSGNENVNLIQIDKQDQQLSDSIENTSKGDNNNNNNNNVREEKQNTQRYSQNNSLTKEEQISPIRKEKVSEIIDSQKNNRNEIRQQLQQETPQQNKPITHTITNEQKIKFERDFYFEKLKTIDHLIEVYERKDLDIQTQDFVSRVKDILYSLPGNQVTIEEDEDININNSNQRSRSHQQNIKQRTSKNNNNIQPDSLENSFN